jgi:pre-mRNA-processing factor 40
MLSSFPWKEYTSDSGKVYYYNTTTKESRWTAPPEYLELKQKVSAEKLTASAGPSSVTTPITSPFIMGEAVKTPGSNENSSSSAMDHAMAATLAQLDAIEVPNLPKNEETHEKPPAEVIEEPVIEFKDKKEAIEGRKMFQLGLGSSALRSSRRIPSTTLSRNLTKRNKHSTHTKHKNKKRKKKSSV